MTFSGDDNDSFTSKNGLPVTEDIMYWETRALTPGRLELPSITYLENPEALGKHPALYYSFINEWS